MKRTFIGLLLLFFAGSVFAQNPSSPYYGFRLGLTAHPTIGWIKPDIGKSEGVSIGFSYGLMGDFNFTQNYSFATGISITTINGKSKEIVTTPAAGGIGAPSQAEYNLKYELQYVDVPLTLKLKTVKINNARYYGQFGLSNGINIGAKQDVDITGGSSARDVNISDDIKFYRAGLIIGAGAEFDISENSSISTGLTFNNGFSDITSNKNTTVRNHYVAINFGVFF